MRESIHEEGLWWIPGAEQQVSVGTLHITDNDLAIKSLVGPLSPPGLPIPAAPPLVLGRSHSGKLYTCLTTGYEDLTQNVTPAGGHSVCALGLVTALRGGHFAALADIVFTRVTWLYSNLHTWLFDLPNLQLQDIRGQRGYQVSEQRGDLWDVDLGDGFHLRNDFSFQSSWKYSPNPAVFFSHVDGISVRCEEPRPIRSFPPLERRFRALVDFLGDCQLDVASTKFAQADAPPEFEAFDQTTSASYARRQDATRGMMPVPFSSLNNFAEILQRWFASYDRLGPVVNLYLHGKQNAFLDAGNTFLGVIQALEAYHRSFRGDAFMPRAEYDAAVRPLLNAAIPAAITGQFRQRLQSAIEFGFEFSLRRRLRELVDILPVSPVFAEATQADFRNRTVDTRNTMTHQIPHPAFPPMAGAELYNAVLTWREVLYALILLQLGISAEAIVRAVERLQLTRGTYIAL